MRTLKRNFAIRSLWAYVVRDPTGAMLQSRARKDAEGMRGEGDCSRRRMRRMRHGLRVGCGSPVNGDF